MAHTWTCIGSPSKVALVELGPGRGTLMADMLRATANFAPFKQGLQIHMVEVSPELRRRQFEALRCSRADTANKPDTDRRLNTAQNAGHAATAPLPVVGKSGDATHAQQQTPPAGSSQDTGPTSGICGMNGAEVGEWWRVQVCIHACSFSTYRKYVYTMWCTGAKVLMLASFNMSYGQVCMLLDAFK